MVDGAAEIAGQQGVDVVRPALTGLHDQRQIRRQGAVLRRTGGQVVGVGRLEVVGRQARTISRRAIVPDIGDRLAGRDGRDLLGREANAGEVAVIGVVQLMARRAHLVIDLEAALGGRTVKGAKRAGEAPGLLRQGRMVPLGTGRSGGKAADECRGGGGERNPAHHAFSIGLAAAPEGNGPPPRRTGLLMLSGRGSGRSSLPSTGRITRKCRK